MHNNINYIANRNHSKQYIFYPFLLTMPIWISNKYTYKY